MNTCPYIIRPRGVTAVVCPVFHVSGRNKTSPSGTMRGMNLDTGRIQYGMRTLVSAKVLWLHEQW